jgi:hypothetical protein
MQQGANMITPKQFFAYISLVLFYALMIGLVLPFLLSAKSTIAVFAGICAIIVLVAAPVYYIMFVNKKESK